MTSPDSRPPYFLTPPSLRSSAAPVPDTLARCGLTPRDLDLLRSYGDLLVPGDGAAPRFSEADPDGEVLTLAVEQVGHRLKQILAAVEATAGAGPRERLAGFQDAEPETFGYLRDVLVCCYLSTQRVWELIGYDGRKPRPPRPGEAEMYLAGGILDQVVERGPVYRLPEH